MDGISVGNIKRLLKIKLPKGQSAFLWGPRKTGKSTYLKEHFKNSIYYDFLDTNLFFEFSKNPSLLRQKLEAQDEISLKLPIVLDEVQKIPNLLDEVHWLIENKKYSFILCGSSARKLKRGQANLLGGRAWRYELFPLVTAELEEPDVLKILNHGMVPSHYLQNNQDVKRSLKAYVQDYLKEEIIAEGLSRNIAAFSRFLDAAAYTNCEMLSYANIARDCGIDAKTVKEYFQILSDTLLGSIIEPFKKRQSRNVINKAPKFYFFDVGIAGALIHRNIVEPRGEQFGKAFEHLILMELKAYSSYSGKDFNINYWRTKQGSEVDFILADGQVALEVKSSSRVDNSELKAIHFFEKEYHPQKAIVVTNESGQRVIDNIHCIPWKEFLLKLWDGKII